MSSSSYLEKVLKKVCSPGKKKKKPRTQAHTHTKRPPPRAEIGGGGGSLTQKKSNSGFREKKGVLLPFDENLNSLATSCTSRDSPMFVHGFHFIPTWARPKLEARHRGDNNNHAWDNFLPRPPNAAASSSGRRGIKLPIQKLPWPIPKNVAPSRI